MQNHSLDFYDSPLSPCARRVRVTLAAKQIPHQLHYVDLVRAEQKTPAYKAINPYGKVPALRHNGQPLWESNIITQYLDEAFDGPQLYPADAVSYAQVREWQAFEIRLAQSFFMLMYHRTAGTVMRVQKKDLEQLVADIRQQSDDPAFLEFSKKAFQGTLLNKDEETGHEQVLTESIQTIEAALADGRPYLIGQPFSQADISVFPRMRMLPYLDIQVSKAHHPRTASWLQRVARHPSMRASMTANEQLMASPLMLGMIRWAGCRSLKPASELSFSERLRLRLLRKLFSLDALVLERTVNRIRKLLPGRAAVAPYQTEASVFNKPVELLLHYNPATQEGRTARDIVQWLGIDCELKESEEALPSLSLDGSTSVHGLQSIVDVLHRARSEAAQGFPADAYLRARARIWVGGDKEGETKYLKPALDCQDCAPHILDAARNFTSQQLQQADAALTDGDCLVGEFGFADIATARRLQAYCQDLGPELLEDFPRVQQWMSAVENRLTAAASATHAA